jgi:curved DNA-binding protein CbpA
MSTMNYYVVLGVAEDADDNSIRSAFRALARRYHPDAGAGSSTADFQQALEAYETLGDPHRRRLYDQRLRGARVHAASVSEPILSRSKAEPLYGPRVVSFAYPSRRVSVSPSTLFNHVLDELFASLDDDWFWDPRWR